MYLFYELPSHRLRGLKQWRYINENKAFVFGQNATFLNYICLKLALFVFFISIYPENFIFKNIPRERLVQLSSETEVVHSFGIHV
jgi:hypothetical protein